MIGSGLRVALAAGGTAGHIEPALNLADALRELDPSTRILVIGGTRGLESTLVPARGYDLVTLESAPMPRRISMDLLRIVPRSARSVREASACLLHFGADAVVGFGGYAALPTYVAARRMGVPLVIHEANAKQGLANRVGSRFTSHVYASVQGAVRGAQPMGLPLRQSLTSLDRLAVQAQARAHFGLDEQRRTLLVFGGSQGAAHLNEVVADVIDAITEAGGQVLHAYGTRNAAPVERPGYAAVPYLERMDLAYAAADLALTRAGAMTCAEMSAVGLPAVYVPLPIGNGEQRLNALPIVRAGGGLIVSDSDLTGAWMREHALPLLGDQESLLRMSRASASCGVRDAGERLARAVLEVASAWRGTSKGTSRGPSRGTST